MLPHPVKAHPCSCVCLNDADLEEDTEGEGEGDHHQQPGDAEEDPAQEAQPRLLILANGTGCNKNVLDPILVKTNR